MMKKMYIEPQTEALKVVATATILTGSPGEDVEGEFAPSFPGMPNPAPTPKL